MKPNVIGIMQARMGSSRLPGKILKQVKGVTFLEHAFERLKMASSVDKCVVATTTQSADEEVVKLCEQQEWLYIRGSEIDVLDRYYKAALKYSADIIVRVTSDCPLLDPKLIDEVVLALVQNDEPIAYASNVAEPRTFPRGLDVEAFTFRALEIAWKEATQSSEREHVTPYIREILCKDEQIKIINSEDRSQHRWTLDTPEDLELLTNLLTELPDPVAWEEVMKVFEDYPNWADINVHIEQKKV